MANANTLNAILFNPSELFYGVWKLTRTLLAAGYRYRSSGNGQASGSKDTTGDSQNDLWAYGGAIHLTSASRGTGSGSGVNIAAASATTGQATISSVSGFTSASVSDYLVITGSAIVGGPGTNGSNNGNYRIVSQTGTTVTIYAPGLVAETGNASLAVSEQFGGADGSITTFTSTGSPLINFTTSSFNGFTAADVGSKITIINSASSNNGTYTIAQFVSGSHVVLYSPPNATSTAPAITANDTQNPTLQWVCYDPRQQLYPLYISAANGAGAWHNFQGPSTLKIPIGANVPTGTFIRGENITQTTTGAQGELLGVITDSGGGTGYLVVNPRIYGTGAQATGVRGWNASANTDTITGAFSGATVTTPVSSTPIEYISEWVIWKSSATQGHIYHQKIDRNPATESATSATTGRFSTMATSGTVTAQVAPASSAGSTPTTNGFPTVGTYTVIGTATNGTVTTTPSFWSGGGSGTLPGRFHCLAANCIESLGVSADGSWFYLQSCSSIGYQAMSYQRMDNQEDGDLDPYVHQAVWSGTINAAPNRTQDSGGTGSATDNMNIGQTWFSTATSGHPFKGFRRRGLSGETFNYFNIALLFAVGNNTVLTQTNLGNPDQLATVPNVQYVRDLVWAYLTPYTAQLASGRMRKGTCRWLQYVQGGVVNTTFDGGTWICLSSSASFSQFVAGPWDGSTQPTF